MLRLCVSHADQSVLNTPCVMGALQELQLAQDTGLPFMLALIGQWLCHTHARTHAHTHAHTHTHAH